MFEQRTEARRRIARLYVGASPVPEVQAQAAAVEEALLRTGANPVALGEHPPLRGWLDPLTGQAGTVLVEQHVPEQSASLLGLASGKVVASVVPELPLRGALHVALRGLSAPVTVCAPPEELDPTPCLAPGDLRVDSPVARLDGEGRLHLVEVLDQAAAVDLARRGRALVLPLAVSGRRLAAVEWPLRFQAPADLVLEGPGPGTPSPALEVRVDGRDPARLLYAVSDGQRLLQAVVERADAPAFHVVSRGAAGQGGASGSSGSDGSSGSSGWSASCPASPGSAGPAEGTGRPGAPAARVGRAATVATFTNG